MIFRCYYVNLTILKLKTLMDINISNKKLKKEQNDTFLYQSKTTTKNNGPKVILNHFKIYKNTAINKKN